MPEHYSLLFVVQECTLNEKWREPKINFMHSSSVGEFDMRVKACEASDGHGGHSLQLSDPEGCIVRPKLLGRFSKVIACAYRQANLHNL